jgi:hypothetical protein
MRPIGAIIRTDSIKNGPSLRRQVISVADVAGFMLSHPVCAKRRTGDGGPVDHPLCALQHRQATSGPKILGDIMTNRLFFTMHNQGAIWPCSAA